MSSNDNKPGIHIAWKTVTYRSVMLMVLAGMIVAQIKVLRAQETAQALRARILAHLAHEAQPELADVRVVRSPADFDPMMPPYVTAFLRHVWREDRTDGA